MKELNFIVTALLRMGVVFTAAVAEATSRKFSEIRDRLNCELYKRGISTNVKNSDCANINELRHTH